MQRQRFFPHCPAEGTFGMPRVTTINDTNDFIRLRRDPHSVIMDSLSFRDCLRLSSTCTSLWASSQPYLLRRVLRESSVHHGTDTVDLLLEVIAFNPMLQDHGFNYRHLVHIITCCGVFLSSMIKTDPDCARRIAAVCGLSSIVLGFLRDKKAAITDEDLFEIIHDCAVGGQLELLKLIVGEYRTPYDHEKYDPDYLLPHRAAFGGHIHVLKYLQELGYDLKKIVECDYVETLLTPAVCGGHQSTIDFLIDEVGVNPRDGFNLAITASNWGQWEQYDRFAPLKNPILCDITATPIECDAVRNDNLPLALALMEQYKTNPLLLVEHMLIGGHPKIFWHFINNGWLALGKKFENEALIEHILARQAHNSLLKDFLKFKKATQDVFDLTRRSLLHYAAISGNWELFCYLRNLYYKNMSLIDLPRDLFGNTVCHAAAQAGSVWFLKHMQKTEAGRQLMMEKNLAGETLLDSAADCECPNFLMMLEEFFSTQSNPIPIIEDSVPQDEGDSLGSHREAVENVEPHDNHENLGPSV